MTRATLVLVLLVLPASVVWAERAPAKPVLAEPELAQPDSAEAVLVGAPVLVLAKPVARGSRLTAASLAHQRTGAPVAAVPAEFRGVVARRHLSRGHRLRLEDFESPPLVRRNDDVLVRVRKGSLLVTMQGRCLGEGRLGETVRVRNRRGSRSVEGIVVGPGIVDVPF